MTKPTPKAKAIDDFLTQLNGMSREDAIEQHVCVQCREDAGEFVDGQSAREYLIAASCQTCQDDFYGIEKSALTGRRILHS